MTFDLLQFLNDFLGLDWVVDISPIDYSKVIRLWEIALRGGLSKGS